MLRKTLLVCGILSSMLYAAMMVFIARQWPGYSSASQTISELSAIGAPTRSLWLLPGAVYTVLVTAFGWGVWKSAGRIRRVAHRRRPDPGLRFSRSPLAVCTDAPP